MEPRTPGFLSNDNFSHNSEPFDYIKELHKYLWEFVRCEIPGASGKLNDFVDDALLIAKKRANRVDKAYIEAYTEGLRDGYIIGRQINKENIPQPCKSVSEFYNWCVENNDLLFKKGHDVLGCVREWEDYLFNPKEWETLNKKI